MSKAFGFKKRHSDKCQWVHTMDCAWRSVLVSASVFLISAASLANAVLQTILEWVVEGTWGSVISRVYGVYCLLYFNEKDTYQLET